MDSKWPPCSQLKPMFNMYKYIFMSKMIFGGRRTDCIINDNFPVVIPTYTPNLHKHAYELYIQNGRHLTYL